MSDNVEMVGMKEIGDRLDLLSDQMKKKIVKDMVRVGTEVIRAEAKRLAPISHITEEDGELEGSITSKDMPTKDGQGGYLALIGARYKRKLAAKSRRPGRVPSSEDPGVYASFVELGRPGKSGHTHQTAQPFMRPAFDSKKGEAVQKAADVGSAAIAEALK